MKEEKGGRGFFVADLTEVYVASDEEVYRILKVCFLLVHKQQCELTNEQLGNANKKISSTSKCHIFQIEDVNSGC